MATALSFVVQFQPAVRSVSGIGASDGRARRCTGPVTPLPGCVEAGGSLAGNVISNSMDRIRSCSSFDLRCRLASLIVNSRWCGRHRTYALPKALSRLGGLSQEGEMTSKRAVRLADAPEGGSRSQLRAPKSATLSGAPKAASLPVSDSHFATGRCRPEGDLQGPLRGRAVSGRKRTLTEVVSAPEVGWVGNLALFLLVERGLSQAGNVAFKT